MKIRHCLLAGFLCLLCALLMVPSLPAGLAEAPSAPKAQFDIHYVYVDPMATSLYHLYGTVLDDLITFTLTNNGPEDATLLVETQIDGYTTTSSDTVDVTSGETVEVRQNPRLIPERIDTLNAQHPGNLDVRITQLKEGEDDILLKESKEITLYSRRDMVWIEDYSYQQEYELYAAWVTPNDPAVEELIRKAADYTESGIMTNGYGGAVHDENGTVWDRLQAIWQAEDNDYDLTYISTIVGFDQNWCQRVRTPYEVLSQRSGNCIETSLLYASAAEALKLEPALIFVPGHTYVAIRTDDQNASYYFIETTLIGRAGFSQAVDYAAASWEEDQPHVDAQDDEYAWVNINEAREKGILPMPWR